MNGEDPFVLQMAGRHVYLSKQVLLYASLRDLWDIGQQTLKIEADLLCELIAVGLLALSLKILALTTMSGFNTAL